MSDATLPAPFTSEDCDLRGYEFMPLFGTRLFGSELYALALENPRAGWAALKLWWEAYARQCPAGSLPNNDRVLARLADFGSDLRGWNKVKATALHGFILCSDGRLYHHLLCDEARDFSEKRRKDRERKRAKKAASQIEQPIENTENTPANSDGTNAEFRGNSDATGQDRTGQDRTVQSTQASNDPAASENLGPRRNAKPGEWRKAFPRLQTQGDANAVMHPIAGKDSPNPWEPGSWIRLSTACDMICTAAGINDPAWKGDWRTVIDWLESGYDTERHIVPAIRRFRAALGDKYQVPRRLWSLNSAVRNYHPKQAAA